MPHAGETAALVTALLWTVSTLSFSSAGRRVGSLAVNWIRLVMALGFLTIHGLLLRGGKPFPTDASPETWLWLGISGFIGFFLGDLCLFKAFIVIGPRLTVLLMSLAPPMAAGFGFLALGEELSVMDWIGMLVTLLGVGWVVVERQPDQRGQLSHPSVGGVVLAILAAVGQAVGAVLSNLGMRTDDYDPFAATQIRVFPGILGFTIVLAAVGWFPRVAATLRQPRVTGLIALGSLTGPYLGVGLFLLSMKHIPTGVAQTIVAIVPVLIIPFVIVLYKERVSWRAAMGAVVATAGVMLLVLE